MIDRPVSQTWSRYLPALLIISGAGPLAVAYYSEWFQGAEPCILCLYQRVPFALVILAGLFAWYRPQFMAHIGLVAGALFASGMGIAFYHVGVEQHWWISSCGGELPEAVSAADFMKQLSEKPEKACDELDWTLFGISMATYNVAYSMGMALISVAAAIKLKKSVRP
jgi:disulfide bond formation protein DsbB